MSRAETKQSYELNTFRCNQAMKNSLAHRFGLDGLYSGKHTIRNEKGWRDNELVVDYIWIAKISRSFVGFGGLMTIKFNANEFRGIKNPEKLIQGIFLYDSKGKVREFCFEEQIEEIHDPVYKVNKLELFTANRGITVDGVSYEYNVIANNMETQITVNNPKSEHWKNWENEIWDMGNRLAKKTANEEMKQLFE